MEEIAFLSRHEEQLNQLFLENGFVIMPVTNRELLDRIQKLVADETSKFLQITYTESSLFLNQIHGQLDVEQLNETRLNAIETMNAQSWFRAAYYHLAKEILDILVGNELAMQLRVNLSVQLPQDDSSLLPVHADVWAGDSPFEVVVWLPLVDCYGTKAMYLLPPKATEELYKNFHELSKKNSEELFHDIKPQLKWIEIQYGQVLIFNHNLPHGNRVNNEQETRWTMNCRFKSVFTPYGDKRIGEFFEPITLRAASRVGMNYKFPNHIQKK